MSLTLNGAGGQPAGTYTCWARIESEDQKIKYFTEAFSEVSEIEKCLVSRDVSPYFTSFVVARFDTWRHFFVDLLIPNLFGEMIQVKKCKKKLSLVKGAFFLVSDITTLAIRILTLAPRYIYWRLYLSKESHPLYKFFENRQILIPDSVKWVHCQVWKQSLSGNDLKASADGHVALEAMLEEELPGARGDDEPLMWFQNGAKNEKVVQKLKSFSFFRSGEETDDALLPATPLHQERLGSEKQAVVERYVKAMETLIKGDVPTCVEVDFGAQTATAYFQNTTLDRLGNRFFPTNSRELQEFLGNLKKFLKHVSLLGPSDEGTMEFGTRSLGQQLSGMRGEVLDISDLFVSSNHSSTAGSEPPVTIEDVSDSEEG